LEWRHDEILISAYVILVYPNTAARPSSSMNKLTQKAGFFMFISLKIIGGAFSLFVHTNYIYGQKVSHFHGYLGEQGRRPHDWPRLSPFQMLTTVMADLTGKTGFASMQPADFGKYRFGFVRAPSQNFLIGEGRWLGGGTRKWRGVTGRNRAVRMSRVTASRCR
jgi:hypothetical protein